MTPQQTYLTCLKQYQSGTITRQQLAHASRTYYNTTKNAILAASTNTSTHITNLLRYSMLMERYRHNRTAMLYTTKEADDTAYNRIKRMHARLLNEARIAKEIAHERAYTRKQTRTVIATHPITHLRRRVPYQTSRLWQEQHNSHECPTD